MWAGELLGSSCLKTHNTETTVLIYLVDLVSINYIDSLRHIMYISTRISKAR